MNRVYFNKEIYERRIRSKFSKSIASKLFEINAFIFKLFIIF